MLDKSKKISRLSQGPSIAVKVYADQKEITQIDLYSHAEVGLLWQMVGEYDPKLESLFEKWLEAYCAGKQKLPPLPLRPQKVTPFTQTVLEAIARIPFGKALTYGELAASLGNPDAARPVGGACGRNKYPLVIPCHRVIASGKKIGGFALDLSIKERLLKFEGFF
jgi:O-6-methylguanine DNA methyltransferase